MTYSTYNDTSNVLAENLNVNTIIDYVGKETGAWQGAVSDLSLAVNESSGDTGSDFDMAKASALSATIQLYGSRVDIANGVSKSVSENFKKAAQSVKG